MKLTDQNVPPEFQKLYDELVSTNKAAAGGKKRARTRRKVRKVPPVKPEMRASKHLKELANWCIRRLIDEGWPLDEKSATAAEFKRLQHGEFVADYWIACQSVRSTRLESLPMSIGREFIQSYLYPDPLNRPTLPTYPDGFEVDRASDYFGETVGGYFTDQRLVWQRDIFELGQDISGLDIFPLFLRIDGSLDINASARGCKAFRALTWRAVFCNSDSPGYDDIRPPVTAVSSIWPTTKAQPVAAPYYRYTQAIDITRELRQGRKNQDPGEHTHVTISHAPRALMGKWFNNNRHVLVTANTTARLMRFDPGIWRFFEPMDFAYGPCFLVTDNTKVYAFENNAGFHTWSPEDGWSNLTPVAGISITDQGGFVNRCAVFKAGDTSSFSVNVDTGLMVSMGQTVYGFRCQGVGEVLSPLGVDNSFHRTTDGTTWQNAQIQMPNTLGAAWWVSTFWLCADHANGIYTADGINQPVFAISLPTGRAMRYAGYFAGFYWLWCQAPSGYELYRWYPGSDPMWILARTNGRMWDFLCCEDCLELFGPTSPIWYSLDGVQWKIDNSHVYKPASRGVSTPFGTFYIAQSGGFFWRRRRVK